MSTVEDPEVNNNDNNKHTVEPPPANEDAATPATADVESQAETPKKGHGMAEILKRWKREDFIRKGSLALRALALLFSFLSFIITASNKHGDWEKFDKFEEYRYLLAIAILSTLYTAVQVLRQVHELSTRKSMLEPRTATLVDYAGDQIMSYLLISAASSAVPLTNRMREGGDDIFTDSSSAAISMAFLAFFALAASAIVSGYKLSTQSYI